VITYCFCSKAAKGLLPDYYWSSCLICLLWLTWSFMVYSICQKFICICVHWVNMGEVESLDAEPTDKGRLSSGIICWAEIIKISGLYETFFYTVVLYVNREIYWFSPAVRVLFLCMEIHNDNMASVIVPQMNYFQFWSMPVLYIHVSHGRCITLAVSTLEYVAFLWI
jgi:hypothetical protein